MARAQSAICPATAAHGLFLTLVLAEGGDAGAVRRALAALPGLADALAAEIGEPGLAASAAIGAGAWERLGLGPKPEGLVPFTALEEGGRKAPATPADLFLHIHSPRRDANLMLARRFRALLGNAASVAEEITGFKHLGNRDMTGFVDGTENPEGDERAQVALVAEGPHAGGSFVSIQRYIHDLPKWDALPVSEQEGAIGRTKASDEELDDAVKPPSAHIARVVIEEDGEELEVLRHSMPYGDSSEHGLYFVAYCASPAPFRKMLTRMVQTRSDGHYDRLLDFTRAVTGASFFAPSVDFLSALS
jgi:putative iron-dependent peroxidase